MLKRVILISALLLVVASSFVAAQDGGQFCVRAFEDRNSNGTRDSSEPFLTRGIVAELANSAGVVVASAALEDSQTSAAGVICFPNLDSGDYMLSVSSAEYRATTANTRAATIADGELPVVLEYGGVSRVVATTTGTTPTSSLDLSSAEGRLLVQRIVVALLGSLAMVALMVVIGVFIWMVILRPRAVASAAKRATSTGQYRAVTRDDMLSMYAPPADDEFDTTR
jgi:hypothetical protein